MARPEHKQYDVVIIGGGMVGSSLACALQKKLAKTTSKILLLESLPIKNEKALQPGFDVRSTVLSFGTVHYLQNLGLWEELQAHAETIKKIHVSDQGHFGKATIRTSEAGVEALGYVLENQAMGLILNQHLLEARETAAQATTRIEAFSPARVTKITHLTGSARLECQQNDEQFTIETDLVVMAEGGRSGLCEQLGIHRTQQDYEQVAVIANVAFSKSHGNIAYERFTPKGPLALLPLSDFDGCHRAALIWTQDASDYQHVMDLSDADFVSRLQSEFGHRLGTFAKVGKRAAFPLSLQKAEEQIRHNLVLLGNVAHTLHPVAGQGFNLAFRDLMRLAANIAESITAGQSPGNYSRLQKYLVETIQDQEKTIGFSHYLTRFFSSNKQSLIWFRKFGLLSIDLLPPLKNTLARQAMGMSDKMIETVQP